MVREPFNLRHIMLAYNLFQTIFNAWLVYKVRFTIVYKVMVRVPAILQGEIYHCL
jgi:hypothetical protein